VRYGLGSRSDQATSGAAAARSTRRHWWAADVRDVPGGSRFTACASAGDGRVTTVEASLSVPGRHNVLNALAALAVCAIVGVPAGETAAALAAFHGTRRRFQLVGEGRGVRVYEDYAHHPTEVRVVLAAARPLVAPTGRLWAVFQPHLRVRTERLFDEFSRAFEAADRVVLTDVYSPAGREPAGNYRGSQELVQAMAHPGAVYTPDVDSARRRVLQEARAGDVVLVMGAGTITQLAWQLAEALAAPMTSRSSQPGSGT
jgi:UDP-N-acetylmuramate--alanine ligase